MHTHKTTITRMYRLQHRLSLPSRLIATRRLASNIFAPRLTTRTFCNNAPVTLDNVPSSSPLNKEHENEEGSTYDVPQHDIAIVGGGMVGMALACSLASMPLTKHLSIAIIDSNPALLSGPIIKKDDPPDPRVSTVTPATISLFKDIGAWEYVEQHRHAYFDKMQVWDYTGFGYTRYNARDADKDVLGCVVENKVLHKSLLSSLQNKDFKKTIYSTRLSSMSLPTRSSVSATEASVSSSSSKNLANLAKLELSDGTNLYAKLVVGADGSKSRVRELSGIKTTGWNYSQSAVICTVEHPGQSFCAYQRFLPSGPIALLPIGDNYSNIVWTMSPKDASNHKIMNETDFIKAINHALDHGYGPRPESRVFGGGDVISKFFKPNVTSSVNEGFEVPPKVVKLVSERMAFPLSLMHANSYVSKRVVLVGDAAHTVHPLAGQGVNMGYGDVSSLSNVIADGVAVGSDIGDVTLLKKYETDRKTANIAMMAVLDGFQKAYSVDFGPLNILRAAAFNGANVFAPLKRNIISYASGERRLPFMS